MKNYKALFHSEYIPVALAAAGMLLFFWAGHPVMMDDGFHYEGFAESLARGNLDFRSFYGFQGLSFFAVPIFWLTHSPLSIIITSAIFSLLSIPLAYAIGKALYKSRRAGMYAMALFLLMPYPYVTLMRGFQEAALLFFILLVIYGSIRQTWWTPIAYGIGIVVKPFILVLFPLFIKRFLSKKKFIFLVLGAMPPIVYGVANYLQTGHFVTLATTGAYTGMFDPHNIPPLIESFRGGVRGFLRLGANFLLSYRKIMIAPSVIVIGLLSLWRNRVLPLHKEIGIAIALLILLVGPLTFTFSKYLLPAVMLFALAAIPIIIKHRWLILIILIDSLTVFIPIYNYFGRVFWSNILVYFIPFILAVSLFVYDAYFTVQSSRHYPNAQ